MKILIVAPTFFPENDVGTFRMTTLADYLLMKGVDVTIIRKDIKIQNSFISTPYRYLSKAKEVKVMDKNKYFESCSNYKKTILSFCKKNSPDLIIYTCAPYYAMKIAPEIIKINKIPYIIDIRDYWLKAEEESIKTRLVQRMLFPIKYHFEKRAFKNAALIIVVSEQVKKKYLKIFKGFSEKFKVVFNGHDDQRKIDDISKYNSLIREIKEGQENKVGISGVLCQYSKKYTETLLKALHEINKEKKIRLYHMGKYEEEIYKIIENNNIDKDIYRYLGYLPNEVCIKILDCMDCNIIIQSRKEGLGTKAFDYAYVKKPVICIGERNTELESFLGISTCKDKQDVINAINTMSYSVGNSSEQYTRSKQNEVYYKYIVDTIC